MNIQIQAINFVVDKELKGFLIKKVDKLISINDSIINADVYLKVEIQVRRFSKDISFPSLPESNSLKK